MWLVVGLGNPGPEYESTYHNVGFRVVERMAGQHNVRIRQQCGPAMISDKIAVGGATAVLVEPQTYMNKSGLVLTKLFERFEATIGDVIVVYDDIAGMRSARLFWFLEFFGHDDVHMLNGGYNAWVAAGLPLTQEATVPKAGNFKMKQRRERVATVDDVLDSISKPESVIIDTRSDGEYKGMVVRAARGGAIPGAVHLEWTNNLDDKGFFKPAEQLRSMYEAHGIVPEKDVIPHCHGGYRSAHTYLALRLIGYPKVRNYLGSWGEWGNKPELPIETPA